MDVLSGLLGQRAPEFMTAAGFSDSPHFMYSGASFLLKKEPGKGGTNIYQPAGYRKNGEWFQLYWIGFGGELRSQYS